MQIPSIFICIRIVVEVVVGQTVVSISSKTLAYDCLCTLEFHVHGVDDCYQLTHTFWGFSAQCLSKLFFKEFTVLLLATSFGKAFQVVPCGFGIRILCSLFTEQFTVLLHTTSFGRAFQVVLCGLGIRIHPTFALVRVVRVD